MADVVPPTAGAGGEGPQKNRQAKSESGFSAH